MSQNQRNTSHRRYQRQVINYKPDFHRYEREKQAWIALHPEADPIAYQDAMRTIANDCGI